MRQVLLSLAAFFRNRKNNDAFPIMDDSTTAFARIFMIDGAFEGASTSRIGLEDIWQGCGSCMKSNTWMDMVTWVIY